MRKNLKSILASIEEARREGMLVDKSEILSGYSGNKLLGTLQRLSNKLLDENTVYLEIGVYQGLTLLSNAIANPNCSFYGIDNFAFFDQDGQNEAIINERIAKLNLKNAFLINRDYEDALENLQEYIGDKKVGVFFIDGPHDYRSQLMCLLLIKPFLADEAVILIDDSNYNHVRQANRDFLITHQEFSLIYESYTPSHPKNLSSEQIEGAKKGYWNGLNVLYKNADNKLGSNLPETIRNRSLFEEQHYIHSLKYPMQTLGIIKLFNKFRLFPLYNLFSKPNELFIGKYSDMNTFSDDLPKEKYHPELISGI